MYYNIRYQKYVSFFIISRNWIINSYLLYYLFQYLHCTMADQPDELAAMQAQANQITDEVSFIFYIIIFTKMLWQRSNPKEIYWKSGQTLHTLHTSDLVLNPRSISHSYVRTTISLRTVLRKVSRVYFRIFGLVSFTKLPFYNQITQVWP